VTTGFREDDGLRERNDFKRTRLLNAQADYRVNDQNSLEFEFGLADGARGEGNINEDAILFLPRTKQINNHYELIRWRHNGIEDSDFMLQGYHSFDRSDDQSTSIDIGTLFPPFVAPNTFINSKIKVETERYDVEAQHNFSVGTRIRAVWGGSVRQDSMYAPQYLGTDRKDYFDLQRLFGHAEWRAHDKLLFNIGAMIEHNDFSGTDTSPRMSINFQPSPNHTIRIGASSALRTPNYLEEKFNSGVSVPLVQPFPLIDPRTGLPFTTLLRQFYTSPGNVKPEQIVSREIAYLGKIGRFNIDGRIFHDSITHHIRLNERPFTAPPGSLLVPGTADDVYGGGNEGSASVDGIEAQVKWQLLASTQLLMNFAHVQVRETKDGLERNYEDAMPNNTFSALLTHRFNSQWDASFAYYQASQASMLGDGDPVDLMRRADVRLARKFNSGKWHGEVAAVIENVFNHQYEEFADYNTLGRRARLNVSVNY
jgi:iron complex outermembrane recepter protein